MRVEDFNQMASGMNQMADASTRQYALQEAADKKKEEDAAKAANVAQAVGEATAQHQGIPLDNPSAEAPKDGAILGSDMLGSVVHHVEKYAHKLFSHGLADNSKPNGAQGVAGPNSPPDPSSPVATAAPPATPAGGAAPSPAAAATPAGASSPPIPAPAGAPAPGAQSAIPPGLAAASPEQKQATIGAVKEAAAQGGVAQAAPPPGKPHSMTHADWDELDRLQLHAKTAALREGKDPEVVGKSLNAIRTSFIQSGMLKGLSAANVAIMHNDQKGLEQALRNVNYYLPDGQDLNLKPNPTTGTIQMIDPFAPKTADGKPNFIDVTPQHIQLMTQNAVDPAKVQETIDAARTTGAKIAHEHEADITARIEAHAKDKTSDAAVTNAGSERALVPARDANLRMTAQARLNRSNNGAGAAAAAAKGLVTPVQAQTAANGASKAAQAEQQGTMETNTDAASLQYGKPLRNNDKIAYWYQDKDGKKMSPADLHGSASLAGKFGAANVGTMSDQDAAEFGGRAYYMQHVPGKMTTHKGDNGETIPDLRVFRDPSSPIGRVGIWVNEGKGKGHWKFASAYPNLMDELQGGVDQAADYRAIFAPATGSKEDDSDLDSEDVPNPADNATAAPPAPK